MKGLLRHFNVKANAEIKKEMLEREIADAQNALEWSLRF